MINKLDQQTRSVINKYLNSLSKKYFHKTNRVYLYDVISINGVSYPIYTSKPYRNYNLINNRKGFPTDCTAIYASLIRNLRLSIVKSVLTTRGRF